MGVGVSLRPRPAGRSGRSEEHTSELQSRLHLVCRLLLEKKNIETERTRHTQESAIFLVTLGRLFWVRTPLIAFCTTIERPISGDENSSGMIDWVAAEWLG